MIVRDTDWDILALYLYRRDSIIHVERLKAAGVYDPLRDGITEKSIREHWESDSRVREYWRALALEAVYVFTGQNATNLPQ